MGWQKVGNRRYYYERKKVDGDVVSHYIGRGPEAEVIARHNAQLAAAQREEDRLDREKVRAWMERDGVIDAMTDRLAAFIKNAIETQMASVGYHKVNGTWRKARKKRKVNPEVARLKALKERILAEGPKLTGRVQDIEFLEKRDPHPGSPETLKQAKDSYPTICFDPEGLRR